MVLYRAFKKVNSLAIRDVFLLRKLKVSSLYDDYFLSLITGIKLLFRKKDMVLYYGYVGAFWELKFITIVKFKKTPIIIELLVFSIKIRHELFESPLFHHLFFKNLFHFVLCFFKQLLITI